MSMLTDEEKHEAWERLKRQHPYGTTAQLCHSYKSVRGTASAFRKLGLEETAGKVDVVTRLVERRVIITTTVLNRVFKDSMRGCGS